MRVKSTTDRVYYLLADHLGSTSVTTDENGAKLAELRYTAFGETRYPKTAETTPTMRRYTGQLQVEGGLYYYGARFYDSALGRFISADTLIPQPGSPLAWDRYAYANGNPIRYNDPSGHFACEDGNDGWSKPRIGFPIAGADSVGYWTGVIFSKFGIKMLDSSTRKWDVDNLKTAYSALNMINNKLMGKIKRFIGGTAFVITDGGNKYWGQTNSMGVTYHTFDANTKLPLINFLHETGHLLDSVPASANVFSGPLKGTTPNWVDSNGYVDANLLLGNLDQPVQAKYISGEDFDINEYWADAFANYMAGNIDSSNPAGKDMHDYVTGALSTYANP